MRRRRRKHVVKLQSGWQGPISNYHSKVRVADGPAHFQLELHETSTHDRVSGRSGCRPNLASHAKLRDFVLLGTPLDTPAGLVAARIAGAALLALAIACWQARNGERGSPASGVVQAMLFYNFAAALVLVYAGVRLDLGSVLLWPTILLHLGLGIWCGSNIWFTRRKLSRS